MSTPQEHKPQAVKAERLSPQDQFSGEQLNEMLGDDAALVQSGHVQYWRFNDTVGQFNATAPANVWHMELHIHNEDWQAVAKDTRLILSAFWDAQHPEYITATSPAHWSSVVLMQTIGLQQVGILPLADGPQILWGWRKCH
ncbi:MAG: hypothetical protein AAFX90_12590 [Pseudomonadota bacterium]